MPEQSRRPALPRPETPTTTQLGVSGTRIMLRGAIGSCPACGGRHNFRRWFLMGERCPRCSLRFERVDGHWIGAIGLNTVLSFGILLLVIAVGTAISYPDGPGRIVLFSAAAEAILAPIVLFPSSRMGWTAIDLLMRPLRPGEVDPRFVVVDPGRDTR